MLPSGWRAAHLKDLLDGAIKNGFSPVSADSETGYWVLGLGALGDDGINISEVKPVVPENKVLQSLLEPNDFLVSRSNTPNKVGRSIRFQGEISRCSYPDLMMKFRIDEKKANISYIEQLLKSSPVRAYFKNCAAGSSSTMVKINKGILEKTPLLVPQLSEQKKIAKILATWDKAITTTEKLLANSQHQKNVLMYQLLTGKRRFTAFFEDWRKVRVSDVVTINYGKSPKDIIAVNGEFLIYGTGGVTGKTDTPMCNQKAVLIGRKGTIDNPLLMDKPFWAIDTAFYCLPRTGFDISWFYYAISAVNLRSYSEASGVPSLSRDTLYAIDLLAPASQEEQRKISSVLSRTDQEITLIQGTVERLKQEKKSLMQQLLTGKRRVNTKNEAVA